MPLSPTKIALDEMMRGYWLIRTSAMSEQEIASIRIVTEGSTGLHWTVCCEESHSADNRGQTERKEVRDDRLEHEHRTCDKTGSARDNFHTLSDGEEYEAETDLGSLDEKDLWYATDDKAEYETMIGLREARMKLQHATPSKRFHKNGDTRREHATSNRSKSIQELTTVTTCNRCGVLIHWEDECLRKLTPTEIITE